ncbi:MAG TPA: PEP/pyruvate-binding domain-containing protein [Opitutus sp.]|nr:PEP/pyruvate-binding domain-containing protein [Opitutus sp.]
MNAPIRWFSEIGIGEIPVVGGKNASLGEMFRELTAGGIRVSDGFATTADIFRLLRRETKLDEFIHSTVAGIDVRSIQDRRPRGVGIRHGIPAADLPAVIVMKCDVSETVEVKNNSRRMKS